VSPTAVPPLRPSRSDRLLARYLRDHASAAQAGVDLFERMASAQSRRPWGPQLVELADEVRDDLHVLLRLLRDRGVATDPWLTLAFRVGERVGRLKPNGRLVRRSPLSDLIEVEAGMDAVHAKLAGWRALRSASLHTSVDLAGLEGRAQDQLDRLRPIHRRVADAVL
jgi:hypothetical protein